MKIWDWVCGALCVSWLLVLVKVGHPTNDLLDALWSTEMAAWVQAIGSIGAVVAVGLIAKHEHERTQRSVEEAEDQLVDALAGFAEGARDASKKFESNTAIQQGTGTSAKHSVESFDRHCAKARTALDRLLTGRSANASLLMAAADLSATLEFKPTQQMKSNATLANLEAKKLTGEFEAIRVRIVALR